MGPRARGLMAHARSASIEPFTAARLVSNLGFLAHADRSDGRGPNSLLVALRPTPTLHHYDPEAVDYWTSNRGRGELRTITRATPMPLADDVAWGLIRLVDRLRVSNEYLTFGGHVDAALVDDAVIVAFTSPAPLLRRGGHSQGFDLGADEVGAFFARLMVAVDFQPGFEAAFAATDPMTRYAAFLRDAVRRRRGGLATEPGEEALTRLVRRESARVRAADGPSWEAAGQLMGAAFRGRRAVAATGA